jgi:hypothetical protein
MNRFSSRASELEPSGPDGYRSPEKRKKKKAVVFSASARRNEHDVSAEELATVLL